MNELLHDVQHIGLAFGEKFLQLVVIFDFPSVGGTHAVVRLGHHRVPHLFNKGAGGGGAGHQMPPCGGNARLGVGGLHFGLVLDEGHVLGLETGGNVEIGAQAGVPLQPVFVVGLQPVDAPMLERQKRHSAIHLIVVFQIGDFVIFVDAGAQIFAQLIVGLVTDAQHVHAVVFQLAAELPVVGGKIGG